MMENSPLGHAIGRKDNEFDGYHAVACDRCGQWIATLAGEPPHCTRCSRRADLEHAVGKDAVDLAVGVIEFAKGDTLDADDWERVEVVAKQIRELYDLGVAEGIKRCKSTITRAEQQEHHEQAEAVAAIARRGGRVDSRVQLMSELYACPDCGCMDADKLVWTDDGTRIKCDNCGLTYCPGGTP
jgi:ribosomal protein S27E